MGVGFYTLLVFDDSLSFGVGSGSILFLIGIDSTISLKYRISFFKGSRIRLSTGSISS